MVQENTAVWVLINSNGRSIFLKLCKMELPYSQIAESKGERESKCCFDYVKTEDNLRSYLLELSIQGLTNQVIKLDLTSLFGICILNQM